MGCMAYVSVPLLLVCFGKDVQTFNSQIPKTLSTTYSDSSKILVKYVLKYSEKTRKPISNKCVYVLTLLSHILLEMIEFFQPICQAFSKYFVNLCYIVIVEKLIMQKFRTKASKQ